MSSTPYFSSIIAQCSLYTHQRYSVFPQNNKTAATYSSVSLHFNISIPVISPFSATDFILLIPAILKKTWKQTSNTSKINNYSNEKFNTSYQYNSKNRRDFDVIFYHNAITNSNSAYSVSTICIYILIFDLHNMQYCLFRDLSKS